MAVLGLRFCARAFSSCGKWGPFFIAVRGPLTIAASLAAEHRLQTRRLSNCGSRPSRSAACGILPDQGANPCPLHWQANSQPLRHQGSPCFFLVIEFLCGWEFGITGWCLSCFPLTSSALFPSLLTLFYWVFFTGHHLAPVHNPLVGSLLGPW